MKGKILVVDDEPGIRETFTRILSDEGYETEAAESYMAGLKKLEETRFDMVFSDIMLGKETGLDLLKVIRKKNIDVYIVMVTGHPSIASAQEAIRQGAFDYLTKPVPLESLLRIAGLALSHKTIRDEKRQLRSNLEAIFRSVGDTMITVDGRFNLLEVNEAAGRLCAIHHADAGKTFHIQEDHCQGPCIEVLNKAFHGKKKAEGRRIICHRADIPNQVVHVTASPLLDNAGAVSGAVMVVRDETRLATMEKAMEERHRLHRLIGQSRVMHSLFSLIKDLADVETTVLITGESGTGKELVAEAIHEQGIRKGRPFIQVNCAALPETLLESELFGHVRGAFTGAIKDKVGRFQLADKGTIFLDEIGDTSPAMQLRLLRVLQEKCFERVGAEKTTKVDVRVLTATNRELPKLIAEGKFREDLYYRIKVMQVRIPSLHERREDLPLLVDHFIGRFNKKFKKRIEGVSETVLQIFLNHPWPGNVRELEHTIEHAFVVSRDPVIDLQHLPREYQEMLPTVILPEHLPDGSKSEEKSIREALLKTNWKRGEAADLIKMSRSTLYRKMKHYNILKK